jgi:hypothetical protein
LEYLNEKDEKSCEKRYLQDRSSQGKGTRGRCFKGGEPAGLFRDGRCPLQSMGVFHTGSMS